MLNHQSLVLDSKDIFLHYLEMRNKLKVKDLEKKFISSRNTPFYVSPYFLSKAKCHCEIYVSTNKYFMISLKRALDIFL